jgi:hypothetical protein
MHGDNKVCRCERAIYVCTLFQAAASEFMVNERKVARIEISRRVIRSYDLTT